MRSAIFLSVIAVIATNARAMDEPTSSASASASASAVTMTEPMFDCYRANSAWGFTLSGKVIDSKGDIWSYGRHGQAWLPTRIEEAGASYLTASELQAKFVDAKQIGKIEAKALADNSALIAKAAEGKVTQTDTGTRDAGASTCHAYIRDEAKQRYRDIDLGSDGGVSDVRITNAASEAQTLLIWLKSVSAAN